MNNNQNENEGQIRNIYSENLASIQKMKQKVEIGLQNKEIWNENLLKNMINKAQDYLAYQYIQIIFLGMQGSGKTTLINSVLGDEIIPYFIGKNSHQQILFQVGYTKETNLSVARCNPQTFKPLNDDENQFQSKNTKEIHSYIEQQLLQDNNNNTPQQGFSQEEYTANNNTIKVFQIRVNSPYFENFPSEIRNNIFFIDTPGIDQKEYRQQQIYISSLKNLSQNSSPSIKYYLWVTSLSENRKKYEKTIFENVCYQLHLKDKNQTSIREVVEESKQHKDKELNNQQLQQSEQQGLYQSEGQMKQNQQQYNLYDSQKYALIEQICNVFKTSSNVSDSDQSNFLNSVNSKFSESLKDDKLLLKSSNPSEEVSKPIEIFHDEEDDFWVIDKIQAQKDDQEIRLRNELVCFLRIQKISRQLIVIFNSHEEKNIFEQATFKSKSQVVLTDYQIKYLNMLERSLQKQVVKVSALPALLCKMYQKHKNNKDIEQEIIKKFYSHYKESLKIKNEMDARKIMSNITFDQEQYLNLVEFENDQISQNSSKVSVESSGVRQTDQQLNTLSQLRATNLPHLERIIYRQLNDLYDYKQMKKRLRIQEVIDKSSIVSRNIILNKSKRDQIELFIAQSLPIIHANHSEIINTNLQNVYLSSLEYRKNLISPKIEEIYSNHKSYQIFDKIEAQLNEKILEYFSESVQNLAIAMVTGDKLIEANKDCILYEINQIDPQLEDGIKSIIIDFKKRSLQDANNYITSNLCISLQQSFSLLGSIIGTSSLFTGLSVILSRMAGKQLIGTGPLGLGVALGMTIFSTLYFVKKRERKLQESKQLILDFFEKIEEEQQKIHQQLIQSYTKVYNEVILVISDYLKGISSINLKQLIDEQKNLHQQDKEIDSSNKKYTNQTEQDSSDNDDESDSDTDSEYESPEEASPPNGHSISSEYKTPNTKLSSSLQEYQQSSFQQQDQQFRLNLFQDSNNSLFNSQQSNSIQQFVSNLNLTQLYSSPQKSIKCQDILENQQLNQDNVDYEFRSILEKQNQIDLQSIQQGNNLDDNLNKSNEESGQDVFYSFSSIENKDYE